VPKRKNKNSNNENQTGKQKLLEPVYIKNGKYACPSANPERDFEYIELAVLMLI